MKNRESLGKTEKQ